MLERLALAFIAGAFAHHWFTKPTDDDAYSEFEQMLDRLPDYIVLAIEAHFDGEPEPELRLVPIEDYDG